MHTNDILFIYSDHDLFTIEELNCLYIKATNLLDHLDHSFSYLEYLARFYSLDYLTLASFSRFVLLNPDIILFNTLINVNSNAHQTYYNHFLIIAELIYLSI